MRTPVQRRIDEDPMLFNVRGRSMDKDTFICGADKARPRPKADGKASYHRGWSVEGFPPGFVEQAEQQRHEDIAHWRSMSAEKRAQRLKDGGREPPAWDHDRFVSNTKRQKVRARPFEIPAAADDAKQLALRSGWTHVEVVELSKGTPPPAGLF